jgi:hypothetical protein
MTTDTPIPPTALRTILGWGAVLMSATFACLWGFWGAIENFHEGWYHESALRNIELMVAQYLSPVILFIVLGLIAQRAPRVGAILHVGLAVVVLRVFNTSAGRVLIALPLAMMGVAYWFGRVPRRRLPLLIGGGLPALVVIVSGAWPAIRAASRIDDGQRGIRIIAGHGVRSSGRRRAPGGRPWAWSEAKQRCTQLSADGRTLFEGANVAPATGWRLPSVDEVVRSMVHHGANAGGGWDATTGSAVYRLAPDKETPLWNPRSQIIDWWTATEVDSAQALSVTYDGKIWPRRKRFGYDYLGYRCVRAVSVNDSLAAPMGQA